MAVLEDRTFLIRDLSQNSWFSSKSEKCSLLSHQNHSTYQSYLPKEKFS